MKIRNKLFLTNRSLNVKGKISLTVFDIKTSDHAFLSGWKRQNRSDTTRTGGLQAEKSNDQSESAFTIDVAVVNVKPIILVLDGSKWFIRSLFTPKHSKGHQACLRTFFALWKPVIDHSSFIKVFKWNFDASG